VNIPIAFWFRLDKHSKAFAAVGARDDSSGMHTPSYFMFKTLGREFVDNEYFRANKTVPAEYKNLCAIRI